jgi:hypothetical protein
MFAAAVTASGSAMNTHVPAVGGIALVTTELPMSPPGDQITKEDAEASMKKKKNIMKKLGSGYIWFSKLEGQASGYYRVSLSDKAGNPRRLNISNLGAWKRVRLWAEVLV